MDRKSRQTQTYMLSIIIVVLCMVVGIMAVRGQQEERVYALGDFSAVSIADAEQVFLSGGKSEELVTLLKVLTYHAVVEKNAQAEPMIAQYGTLLYDRVRAEQLDLAQMGDDETMLELLHWIQIYGAH